MAEFDIKQAIVAAVERQTGKPHFEITDVAASVEKQRAFEAGRYRPGTGYVRGGAVGFEPGRARPATGVSAAEVQRLREQRLAAERARLETEAGVIRKDVSRAEELRSVVETRDQQFAEMNRRLGRFGISVSSTGAVSRPPDAPKTLEIEKTIEAAKAALRGRSSAVSQYNQFVSDKKIASRVQDYNVKASVVSGAELVEFKRELKREGAVLVEGGMVQRRVAVAPAKLIEVTGPGARKYVGERFVTAIKEEITPPRIPSGLSMPTVIGKTAAASVGWAFGAAGETFIPEKFELKVYPGEPAVVSPTFRKQEAVSSLVFAGEWAGYSALVTSPKAFKELKTLTTPTVSRLKIDAKVLAGRITAPIKQIKLKYFGTKPLKYPPAVVKKYPFERITPTDIEVKRFEEWARVKGKAQSLLPEQYKDLEIQILQEQAKARAALMKKRIGGVFEKPMMTMEEAKKIAIERAKPRIGGVFKRPLPTFKELEKTGEISRKILAFRRLKGMEKEITALQKYQQQMITPTVPPKRIFVEAEKIKAGWKAEEEFLKRLSKAAESQALVQTGKGVYQIQLLGPTAAPPPPPPKIITRPPQTIFAPPEAYAQLAKELPRGFPPVERLFREEMKGLGLPPSTIVEKEVLYEGPRFITYAGPRFAQYEGLKFGEFLGTIPALKEFVAPAVKPGVLTKGMEKQAEALLPREAAITAVTPSIVPAEAARAAVSTREAMKALEITKTMQIPKVFRKPWRPFIPQQPIRFEPPKETFFKKPPPTKIPLWFPKSLYKPKPAPVKFAPGFFPIVRRAGREIPLTKFPVSKEAARAIAIARVIATPRASFKLLAAATPARKVKAPALPKDVMKMFRPAKTLPGFFVEKAKYRIDRPEEFFGITLKGLKARRKKKKKKRGKKK